MSDKNNRLPSGKPPKKYLLRVRGRDADGNYFSTELKITRMYREHGYIYACYGRETVLCADIGCIDFMVKEDLRED